MLDDIKWIARPFLAGLALTFWFIILMETGELPPVFLTGLVATAWGWIFVSREKDKADARKPLP